MGFNSSCTITSKDFRQHITTIETEGEHPKEDPAVTIKAEIKAPNASASRGEVVAVGAFFSLIKQVEDGIEDTTTVPLTAKEVSRLLFLDVLCYNVN